MEIVKGILRYNGVLYLAEWQDRTKEPVDMSQVQVIHKVETKDRGPIIKTSWTRAPDQDFCVKTPSLHTAKIILQT